MSSNITPKLPIINLSVKPSTPEWDSARAQVRRAAKDFGCFEAIFDQVTPDTQKAMLGTVQELFDLPLETKIKNVSEKPYHGYIGPNPVTPLFESFGFDEANVHEKVEILTDILWPQGNPKACKTIESYSKQLSDLDQIVRRMILESLGVYDNHWNEHLDATCYLLRFMKYTWVQSNETELGLHEHTDGNFITILSEVNKVGGLEVQHKNGEWISVKASPDSFIVLVGDSLNAFSNGRLRPAKHRVMKTGNERRYSIGLFSVPKLGYIVKTAEELVDEKHPLAFKPCDYHEFLRFHASEDGRKSGYAFKAFCAIES